MEHPKSTLATEEVASKEVSPLAGNSSGSDANGNSSGPVHNGNDHDKAEGGKAHAKTTQKGDQHVSCLKKASNTITGTLEDFFERLGLSIGVHPSRYILGCVLVCLLCSIGLLAFKKVSEPDKLWVPTDSQMPKDKEWIDENYPSKTRFELMIAESSNILTPKGLAGLLDIYEKSLTISTSSGITLIDICIKTRWNCVVFSILEIWRYNSAIIRSLTQEQIISDINTVARSPVYGKEIDVSTYLGSFTTNSTGHITAAQAALMTWLVISNKTVESTTMSWEDEFIELGLAGHSDIDSVYVLTGKSWQEETGKAIKSDISLLSAGYFIVIVFVLAVLGKFNFMEQRAWLTLAGFICIGLSLLVSIGLSSAFQQGYGPLHSVLPFLLLGIGVDDMFVIMGALNNLLPKEQDYDIPQKVAEVLRHAGVSITVTSLTDFVAFMIGATTILPAFRSFCVYAALGILALYALQAVFFTACLTFDLRRLKKQRDACCFCCVRHPSPPYTPNQCSQRQFVPFVFKHGLSKIITKLPFKVLVTVTAVALFVVNIWGTINLDEYFDRNWFLPADSYAKFFIIAQEKHFPDSGMTGYVYCGNLDYWNKKSQLEALVTAMDRNPDIQNGSTDPWFSALTGWLSTTTDRDVKEQLDDNKYPESEMAFLKLTHELITKVAPRTSANVLFSEGPVLDIKASRFPFRHIQLDDTTSQISAMDNMRVLVQAAGFSNSECFPYSRAYISYETSKVVRQELFRNLGLACLCVFIVTLILIANFWTSLLVFCCVLFTLVDVAGTMQFWGLTIEGVTSIVLLLSIGLAVDYSAHIGHMFMTVVGTRQNRTKETLGEMGPPVFYGGFSTFLAFVLLSNSNSYVFQTFFKVNFLVVMYGLFHGLILLPVFLSWMGPPPYPTADRVLRKHHPDSPENGTNPSKEQTVFL
ncbi:patched domain-containing protein 3 [Plakobranchus ocellatus]|uniref:Patched domain-containing protein 3 n=1 Tax=Plakobranchus ocellatus TaxID=259542 RepID=A0AAV4DVT5_9GAST|nr:patched domain-containing protein 3 [Plakobranchus ocellatus]